MLLAISVTFALALGARIQVPQPLSALESVAEDIDDAVVSQDWAKVETLESKGDRALHDLRTGTPAAMRRASQALADAEAATQSRDAMATRFAANHLADAVVDLYEPYHPAVPTSVMRLDVLLRSIDLAAATGQLGEARSDLRKVMVIWQHLKSEPPVEGSSEGASFARDLSTIEEAVKTGDLPAFHNSAVAALEGVDGLEARFEGLKAKARRAAR